MATTSRSNASARSEQTAADAVAWQQTAWLGMSLQTPIDWEIVRHAKSPQAGRLVFIDRRRQRLQFAWAALASRPDLGRMVSDYKSRDLEQDAASRFQPLDAPAGWQGYRGTVDGATLTRAVRYEHSIGRLLELTIPWGQGHDASIDARLLAGVQIPEPGPRQRWCAFRLDVDIDADWVLQESAYRPGESVMRFERGRDMLTIRRLGMVSRWLREPLDYWLKDRIDDREAAMALGTVSGHAAAQAVGWEKSIRAARLLKRARVRRDVVFRNVEADVLFHVTVHLPVKRADEPITCLVAATQGAGEGLDAMRFEAAAEEAQ